MAAKKVSRTRVRILRQFNRNVAPHSWPRVLAHAVQQTWQEFADRTSVHGIKYINDAHGTRFTRLLWIVVPLICFVAANYLVSTFWLRYKSNPIRVNVDTNHVKLNEMDFPAITLCTLRRMNTIQANEIIRMLNLPSRVSRSKLLSQFAYVDGFTAKMSVADPNATAELLQQLQDILVRNRYTPESYLDELMLPCNQLLFRCRLEGKIVACPKLFSRSSTAFGFCCSFNLQSAAAAVTVAGKKFRPYRSRSYGMGRGLSVVLAPQTNVIGANAVRISVSSPSSYVDTQVTSDLLAHGTVTCVEIKPEETFCSEAVRALSVADRGCVFAEEMQLQFFDSYDETNCRVECRMRKIIAVCDCLPYNYPAGENIALCNMTRVPCLIDNYDFIHKSINQKPEQRHNGDGGGGGKTKIICDCPPLCSGMSLQISHNSVPMIYDDTSIETFNHELNQSHMIVHIFLSNQVYRRYRKDLLSSIIGLIANFGGVYSLFIGMSVVAILEVPFFATVRLYRNYKQIKRTRGTLQIGVYSDRLKEFDKNRGQLAQR